MRLPGVVGPHAVRLNPQLDAGVSLNMFPEYARKQSDLAPRQPRWQLSTHGYKPFASVGSRITAMAGSQEFDERLLVAFGRDFRVYNNPADASTGDAFRFTGLPDGFVRAAPVLGAAWVGLIYYWVRDDGSVGRRTREGEPTDAFAAGHAPSVTPLGMAVTPHSDGTDIDYAWFTCVEDRIVRCWRRNGTTLSRLPSGDLDVGDTAINSPESLWMDPVAVTEGARTFWRMLVLDAIGGRVVEFEFEPAAAGDKWRRSTPVGTSNPYDFQRVAGDAVTGEPLVVGGIFAGPEEIRVANRATGKQMIFDRHTGIRTIDVDLPDFGGQRAVGGCVSGRSLRIWYVNGAQFDEGEGGKFFTDAGEVPRVPTLLDQQQADPPWGDFVPMGREDALVGWVLDRRLHIVDLGENRVIQNVEGNVDSLAYDAGRLIGVDASTGVMKVSPVHQVRTTPVAQYGVIEPLAAFRIPGWPRVNPTSIQGIYVGIRGVLVVTNNGLWRYQRENLSAPPVKLSGSATVIGVCVSRDYTAVIEGSGNNGIRVKRFRKPPETSVEYAAVTPADTHEIVLDFERFNIRSFAADTTRLFMVHRTASQPILQLSVYTMATGAKVAGLSGDNFRYDSAPLFGGLTLGVGSQPGDETDWLRGITWSDGVLLVAIRQVAPNPTVIRAYSAAGGTWSAAIGRDLNDDAFTNNTMLAHDAHLVFGSDGQFIPDQLADGTSVRSIQVSAFIGSVDDRVSRYAWDPARHEPTGAVAVASIRGTVYSFTGTDMEIRQLDLGARGFPYILQASRTIGAVAPRSLKVVQDVLYWVGSTAGGGIRLWELGLVGDTSPTPVEGKSIEEMLDRISSSPVPGERLEDAIAWVDDTGGHPVYVLHVAAGGVSLAYDTDTKAWHVRSSKSSGTGDRMWDWMPDGEGVQRVTHSAAWRNKLFCGGFDLGGGGRIAEASQDDWTDIDGGAVFRRRQFSGGEMDRRIIRFPAMRVDAVYGLGGAGDVGSIVPRFSCYLSDDGGKTFPERSRMDREIGPEGGRPPQPFYRMGVSRFRVVRVDCVDPVGFSLLGATIGGSPHDDRQEAVGHAFHAWHQRARGRA